MWDIVWVSPQKHRSVSDSRHFRLQAPVSLFRAKKVSAEIFHWDMAIKWFSKWQQSAILELFYHQTRLPTKSLYLAVAACQISCQSDTQTWRYSYLNFSHIWLEMPIQAPKWGFWRLWPPKCDYSSSRPPKRTSLRKSASVKLSTVNKKLSYHSEAARYLVLLSTLVSRSRLL